MFVPMIMRVLMLMSAMRKIVPMFMTMRVRVVIVMVIILVLVMSALLIADDMLEANNRLAVLEASLANVRKN